MQSMQAFHVDTAARSAASTPERHVHSTRPSAWREIFRQFGIATIDNGYPINFGDGQMPRQPVYCRDSQGRMTAYVRCVPAEITAAGHALAVPPGGVMHILAGVSDAYAEQIPGARHAAIVRMIESAVALARRYTPAVHVTLEDAEHADPAFVRQCAITAADAGAARVILGDAASGVSAQPMSAIARDVAVFLEGRAAVPASSCATPGISAIAL